jgi:hypothetical protein
LLLRIAGGWARGLILCLVPLLLVALLALAVHGGQARLRAHLAQGLPEVMSHQTSGDAWSDCVVLSGVISRSPSALDYLGSLRVPQLDPCKPLAQAMAEPGLAEFGTYDRYWLGPVYLVTIGLGLLDLATLQQVYRGLLLLAIASFGLAGLVGLTGRLRAVPAIVAAVLLAGIGIDRFGGTVSHAPTFIVPLFLLAGFLARTRPPDLAIAALLGCSAGTLTGYLDMLYGGIPFALSLALLVYALRWQNGRPAGASGWSLLAGMATVAASCFLAVVALVALKLFVTVALLGHATAIAEFKGQLLWRISGDRVGDDRLAGLATVVAKLLGKSPPLFVLGETGAVVTFGFGIAGWLAALAATARRYARSRDPEDLLPVLAPLLAAAVVPAWYTLFLSHSFIHAWFMAQLLCLIPALGLAAAWLALAPAGRAAALRPAPAA